MRFLYSCYFQLIDEISQIWNQIKISDMRFAAELTFSRSALKAKLNFDLIPDLRDKHFVQIKKYRNRNFQTGSVYTKKELDCRIKLLNPKMSLQI